MATDVCLPLSPTASPTALPTAPPTAPAHCLCLCPAHGPLLPAFHCPSHCPCPLSLPLPLPTALCLPLPSAPGHCSLLLRLSLPLPLALPLPRALGSLSWTLYFRSMTAKTGADCRPALRTAGTGHASTGRQTATDMYIYIYIYSLATNIHDDMADADARREWVPRCSMRVASKMLSDNVSQDGRVQQPHTYL